MTLPFGMGDVPIVTADPAVTPPVTSLPAPAASATVPPPNAPAPPEKTDWTLVIVSGVAISIVTSLLWAGIGHAHKVVKKENNRLSQRRS